jgi:hypothetical protein
MNKVDYNTDTSHKASLYVPIKFKLRAYTYHSTIVRRRG